MPEDINAYVFPGGKRRIITVSVTLGDAVTNKSPGAGFRWLVIRGIFEIVADGNASNRLFRFTITDGTNQIGLIGGNSTAITAGQTKQVGFGEARLPDSDWDFVDAGVNVLSYTGISPILLEGADQLRITVRNGLAGDSYSGSITVLEMKL